MCHFRLTPFLAALVLSSGSVFAQNVATSVAPLAPASSAMESLHVDDLPPSVLLIQIDESDVPAEIVEQINTDSRFGLGVGGTFLAYGLSGTLDLTETITAEGILGFIGTVTSAGGRLWYRFSKNDAYDVYGYGGVSFLRVGDVFDETAIGVGAGVGIEVGLPQLVNNEDFPPIFLNLDIGLGFSTFEFYNYSAFAGGSGIHYRF